MGFSYALVFNSKQDFDEAVSKISVVSNGLFKCVKCGKDVDQKVVNFCKVRYKGKTLCRDCQKEVS